MKNNTDKTRELMQLTENALTGFNESKVDRRVQRLWNLLDDFENGIWKVQFDREQINSIEKQLNYVIKSWKKMKQEIKKNS